MLEYLGSTIFKSKKVNKTAAIHKPIDMLLRFMVRSLIPSQKYKKPVIVMNCKKILMRLYALIEDETIKEKIIESPAEAPSRIPIN